MMTLERLVDILMEDIRNLPEDRDIQSLEVTFDKGNEFDLYLLEVYYDEDSNKIRIDIGYPGDL